MDTQLVFDCEYFEDDGSVRASQQVLQDYKKANHDWQKPRIV